MAVGNVAGDLLFQTLPIFTEKNTQILNLYHFHTYSLPTAYFKLILPSVEFIFSSKTTVP